MFFIEVFHFFIFIYIYIYINKYIYIYISEFFSIHWQECSITYVRAKSTFLFKLQKNQLKALQTVSPKGSSGGTYSNLFYSSFIKFYNCD